MTRKIKIIVASVMMVGLLSGGAVYLALASDNCQADCETAYKSCKKGCGDDLDCKLDCQDARDICIQGCGE